MKQEKLIKYWLLTGLIMTLVQVLLGGITRLTGSGLSITEWKPILGFLPPLNEAEWQIAFQKYQTIGQYKHLNNYFTISDFKFIFFWEYFHRLWARTIGMVFALPFLYFLVKKSFTTTQIKSLVWIFILGGFQGAIGWIMVKSGINETSLYVDHFKLCLHFSTAMLLVALLWKFYIQYAFPTIKYSFSSKINQLLIVLISLLFVQLCYGAFMAGLHAGPTAPRWPLLSPTSIFPEGGDEWGIFKWINHPQSVQFVHRGFAYVLCLLCIYWYTQLKNTTLPTYIKIIPVFFVILQTLLGIVTVMYSPFQHLLLIFGVLHQFVAMLFWMALTGIYFVSEKVNSK